MSDYYNETMDLNEYQLRQAMRYSSTKALAFCNIAYKAYKAENPFIPSESSDVIVYGRGKKRTVAVRTRHGRKLTFETLGKVSADADGYAEAAAMIEGWMER